MSEWNPRRLEPGERPTATFVRPTDNQMPACLEALAEIIGADAAALPSWQRRIALDADTGALLLLLDVPSHWISTGDNAHDVAPEPGLKLDEWLSCTAMAFPVDTAIRLLGSDENPEAELIRRRAIVKTRDEIRARHTAKRTAEEAARAKAEADATERREKWREPEWQRLTDAQRLLLTVSLKLEARDPALAADLRECALGTVSLPRTQWWLSAKDRTPTE